jgi:hypothetical protein
MTYVYEDGLCIGYMRGDRLIRFITPIRADLC